MGLILRDHVKRYQPGFREILGLGIVLLVTSFPGWIPDAEAIPPFARKYKVNCNVCHVRWPRLNAFGERVPNAGTARWWGGRKSATGRRDA